MSRAGSSQHPRLAAGQPWAVGAAPGIRSIPGDREGPRMAVRVSPAQWAAGRAGQDWYPTASHGGDIPGEAEPGSWAMGRVGTAPGSWAVPVVASEPGTQQLLLVQK